MNLAVHLGPSSYEIVLERGCLFRAGELLNLRGRALIVTDDGVPAEYSARVSAQCPGSEILTIPQGERSKCFQTLQEILSRMLRMGLTRQDCAIAVGGGVVGDLTGFAAAIYMRGIDFYNIPTTVLSQVDSSIGGKTAIDFSGVKNIVGAFHQPKKVLIDPQTLQTLPRRQLSAGLAEALKEALTSDASLFARFETADPMDELDEIIAASLRIKAHVVEQDEREQGLRRILNFGHTIGHGLEAASGGALLHGECVAMGMLPMVSDALRPRLVRILEKLELPLAWDLEESAVFDAMTHDKKAGARGITCVFVDEPGTCRLETVPAEALRPRIASVLKGGAVQ